MKSPERGVIEAVLPRAMVQVRLDRGPVVRAGVDSACRGVTVRLIAGDRVEVRLTERDPTRGQVVRKL